MGTYYVDDEGNGSAPTSGFATGYADLDTCFGLIGAGPHTILVAHDHAKTYGSLDIGYSWPDNIRVISVNHTTPTNYEAGATESSASGYYLSHSASGNSSRSYWQGLTLNCNHGSPSYLNASATHRQTSIYRDCNLKFDGYVEIYSTLHAEFYNCNFDMNSGSGSGFFYLVGQGLTLIMRGCTFSNVAAGMALLISSTDDGIIVADIDGCDLSPFTEVFDNSTVSGQCRANLTRCRVPSDAFENAITNPGDLIIMSHCSTGATITTATHGLEKSEQTAGTVVKETTTKLASGAANDGTRDYSWKITTVGSCSRNMPFQSPMLRTHHAGNDANTLTIRITSDVELTDEEAWIEVCHNAYDADGSSVPSTGDYVTTEANYGAGTNLTADTPDPWGLTGSTYDYKIVLDGDDQIDPYYAGEIAVRFCLAKASATVYLHPIPELS